MLAKDKDNRYLIYRFGTKDKIEFEFPDKNESSWTKFKYSYYSRGGGKRNAAQDLIHISFINNGYKYFLYDTYMYTHKHIYMYIHVYICVWFTC